MRMVAASNVTLTEVNDLCKRCSNEEYRLHAIAGDSPLTICICEEAPKEGKYPREYARISLDHDGAFVTVWHDWNNMGVETLIDRVVLDLGLDSPSFVRFDSVHIVIHYTSRYVKEEN